MRNQALLMVEVQQSKKSKQKRYQQVCPSFTSLEENNANNKIVDNIL